MNPAPGPYRVAAVQFDPTMGEPERNVARLLELTGEAAQAGARLIVLPEMATTGYCWANRAEIAPFVEPIPGPTTDRFAALAARHGCHVVVGMAEVVLSTGVCYNSAALIGPDGLVGVYRKTHPYIAEPKWAKDGDLGLPLFDTPLGRIGIAICMDAVFPETCRVPALLGADVLCFPTNWLDEKSPSATWIVRALESGLSLIAANRSGSERGVQFSGGSCVIDPDGTIQALLDAGDGIVAGTVDPARSRDKRLPGFGDRLADRRPDAYGDITLNTYHFPPVQFHGLYGLRPLPDGRRSTIAVCQFAAEPGEIEGNLARIAALAAEHAAADLLVFPELALTGSVAGPAAAESVAEPLHGDRVRRLTAIAARHELFLVVGLVERADGSCFNTALLVGPSGAVGAYRKLHLTDADRAWATPGDGGLRTFDIPAGRVGLLIGYDALFPEASTCLSIAGADLIACPSLMGGPPVQPLGATAVPLPPPVVRERTDDHVHLWRERARETGAMVAFANGAAPAMGWSGIFHPEVEEDPSAQTLVRGNREGSATFVLDTTGENRRKPALAMRQPIWYDALQAPHQLPWR